MVILILTNANDYKTNYNGVDIAVRKRMSNNFMINGELTLQRQKANYDGGDSLAFYIGDGGLMVRYSHLIQQICHS